MPIPPADLLDPPHCATPLVREGLITRARGGDPNCHEGREPAFSQRSTLHPITVHGDVGDEDLVALLVPALEEAWEVQIGEWGWPAPISDEGSCGTNDLDVFIDRGIGYSYADVDAWNDATVWDDGSAYIVHDPTGYDDAGNTSTIVHEFNHVLQAANDWYETTSFFEMSATFVEYRMHHHPDIDGASFADFVAHPGWPLLHNDEYETWFMYGTSMYLAWIDGGCGIDDPTWLADAWIASRSDPGDGDGNEPDLVDAFDLVLDGLCESSFVDSITNFRLDAWEVGEAGSPFRDGELWDPEVVRPEHQEIVATDEFDVTLEAAPTGAAYVLIDWSGGMEIVGFAVEIDSTWDFEVQSVGPLSWLAIFWPTKEEATDPDEGEPETQTISAHLLPLHPTRPPEDLVEEGGCACSEGAPTGSWALLPSVVFLRRRSRNHNTKSQRNSKKLIPPKARISNSFRRGEEDGLRSSQNEPRNPCPLLSERAIEDRRGRIGAALAGRGRWGGFGLEGLPVGAARSAWARSTSSTL